MWIKYKQKKENVKEKYKTMNDDDALNNFFWVVFKIEFKVSKWIGFM